MKQRALILLLIITILLLGGCQTTNEPSNNTANDPTSSTTTSTTSNIESSSTSSTTNTTTGTTTAPVEFAEPMFLASVLERTDNVLTVIPLESEDEYNDGNARLTFAVSADSEVTLGDVVQIAYDGQIMETYPAQINATACAKVNARVNVPFHGEWIDKTKAKLSINQTTVDLVITAIYADCFFAQSILSLPHVRKINGVLGEEWCVGDYAAVTFDNAHYIDGYDLRSEMDLISIEEGDFEFDPNLTVAKPVIYLYPETETAVDVTLTLDGELTCSYPAYKDGWHVTAAPDGTLTADRGQTYNYLYWEGETNADFDMTRGFCIKGENTAAFLETALADLGLTRREANEFIVYWLPLMEQNPYNLIAFQTDAHNDAAKLNIVPAPDTLIRVFMAFKGVDEFVDIEPQTLSAPARVGFTAVEWGGTEIE